MRAVEKLAGIRRRPEPTVVRFPQPEQGEMAAVLTYILLQCWHGDSFPHACPPTRTRPCNHYAAKTKKNHPIFHAKDPFICISSGSFVLMA